MAIYYDIKVFDLGGSGINSILDVATLKVSDDDPLLTGLYDFTSQQISNPDTDLF